MQKQPLHPVRPLHLKIAASAILTISALLAMLQTAPLSRTPIPARHLARSDAGAVRESAAGKRNGVSTRSYAVQKKRIDGPDAEVGANDTTADDAAREFVTAEKDQCPPIEKPSAYGLVTDDAQSRPPERALRLAAKVRLPAAIMAQDDPELTHHRASLTSETANLAISNNFYRELLSGSNNVGKKEPGNGPDAVPVDFSEVLISAGPEVDLASKRADEAYRAMYGDAAYNRQSMRSAIEVQLPEDAAETGN